MSRIALITPETTRNAAPEFVDRRGALAVYRLLATRNTSPPRSGG